MDDCQLLTLTPRAAVPVLAETLFIVITMLQGSKEVESEDKKKKKIPTGMYESF